MDGHHHNTRHHDRREEEYNQPPPPPQVHHTGPAPPQVHHTSHTGPTPNAPPVYTVNAHHSSPPQVHHTSHTSYSPPPPSHVPSPSPVPPAHHQPNAPAASAHNELANKPSVRMYCKAEPNFSLTIREGKVVLAPSNSADPLQHWIKDEKFSTRVKDEEGFPSFALVNKATGQAMKHSIGATQPVELTPYNSNKLDESILWTESKDLGDGYHAVRMVSNIRLNVDAFNGDKNHGGVHDGTRIVLWEWKKDSNQRWKIVPFCKFLISASTLYVLCAISPSCSTGLDLTKLFKMAASFVGCVGLICIWWISCLDVCLLFVYGVRSMLSSGLCYLSV